MENYLSQQRVHVFSNVGVLIYVFDIDSHDMDRDLATYQSILGALQQFSPGATIFVLIHKMDLVKPELRERMFFDRVDKVRSKTDEFARAWATRASQVPGTGVDPGTFQIDFTPFATSIWDQSLYRAWASIIHDLVPNLTYIEEHLEQLGRGIEAEEMMLFERTSFLVVSQWMSEEGTRNPFPDRQERMSNIIKQFKQSCARYTGTPRSSEQFTLMEFQSQNFCEFICKFTTNTYLLVILPPGEARFNSAKLNVEVASETFGYLDVPGPYVRPPALPAAQLAQPAQSVQAPAPAVAGNDGGDVDAGVPALEAAAAGLSVKDGNNISAKHSKEGRESSEADSPGAALDSASTTEVEESGSASGDDQAKHAPGV